MCPPMFLYRVKFGLLLLTAALLPGCSRPQPSVDQVGGPTTPPDLRVGRTPPGGPSAAPTGAGAGGSAAAGYEAGRVGSSREEPTLPPQPAGIETSRMSPVGSSGSGLGDRGHPIPPEVSLAAPPDPTAPVRLAPVSTVPPHALPARNARPRKP
jgi:hypothetical protein